MPAPLSKKEPSASSSTLNAQYEMKPEKVIGNVKSDHIPVQTQNHEEGSKVGIPSSRLVENWSVYMASMGSHFKQVAEESLFRSQYLAMTPTDPVY